MLDEWGRIDVLVNNGRYIGPGHMDRLVDTPLDLLDTHLDANVMAPLALSKLVLPQMLERGAGLVINMTSDVAWTDPPARPAAAAGDSGTRSRKARCTGSRACSRTKLRAPGYRS